MLKSVLVSNSVVHSTFCWNPHQEIPELQSRPGLCLGFLLKAEFLEVIQGWPVALTSNGQSIETRGFHHGLVTRVKATVPFPGSCKAS